MSQGIEKAVSGAGQEKLFQSYVDVKTFQKIRGKFDILGKLHLLFTLLPRDNWR